MNATMINGATETKAEADKLHHGVIDEFKATILTGKSWTSVKVKMKAKKKSIQPKIIQNMGNYFLLAEVTISWLIGLNL